MVEGENRPGHPKRRTFVDTVVEELTRVILEGELRPGEKLNELEFAKRLGVSRSPIREAGRQLHEAGLLEAHSFRGFFVRSLTQQEVSDVYVLRLLLESTAIAEATRVATAADIAAIEERFRETETAALAKAKGRFIVADMDFHRAVCAAGQNNKITDTFSKLAMELRLVYLLTDSSSESMHAAVEAHAEIVASLRSRNAEQAVDAIRRHITHERDDVLQFLGPHGDSVAQSTSRENSMTGGDTSDAYLSRIIIKPHTPEDFELLARMNRQLIEDQAHRNPMTVDQLRERFKHFDTEGWTIDIFELDNEVIGYAVHRYEPNPAEPRGEHVFLRQFFITRHRRRGGIGAAAFKTLMRTRFRTGDRIYLDVVESNPGGKIFWSRTGFVPYATIMERVVAAKDV